MGKMISIMMKPMTKFNIENRAHKVLSREKPVPAPLLESTKKQLEIARTVNPAFMQSQYRKDVELDERLKNVYVQSNDDQTTTKIEANPNRPLPFLTRSSKEFDYGFWEPSVATEGKCTLRSALAFMAEHLEDPVKHSAKEIATKYKLDLKDVENVLEYYRVFKVIIPEGNTKLAYAERTKLQSGEKKKE